QPAGAKRGRAAKAARRAVGERAVKALKCLLEGCGLHRRCRTVPGDVGKHAATRAMAWLRPPLERGRPQPSQNDEEIQPLCERSSPPTCSTWVSACSARMRLKFSWPARFSAIHSRAKSPDWISARILRIAARVSSVITRFPRV